MIYGLKYVVVVVTVSTCFGQRTTPGRVGGSINNAQANRPTITANHRVAAPQTPLSSNELIQYQQAKAVMPELTQADFSELLQYSQKLNALGKDVSVVNLAATLHKRGGNIVRTLKDLGLSSKQAKTLISEMQ